MLFHFEVDAQQVDLLKLLIRKKMEEHNDAKIHAQEFERLNLNTNYKVSIQTQAL